MVVYFKDKFDNIIKLTDKCWEHIITEHPETVLYKKRLAEVLLKPDLVKRSRRDKDTFLYYRYYKDIYHGKYLLIVANIKTKLQLLTCYITDRIKKGDLIWKKA